MSKQLARLRVLPGLVFAAFFLASCATVPFTGRRQLSLLPEAELTAMSFDSYREVLDGVKLSDDREAVEKLNRVGRRIAAAGEDLLREWGQERRLNNFSWEFNLIDDDETVNAWCMPGGKIAFYTGILPLTKDEAGMAVVMGHEVAHALANHGNERLSQLIMLELGMVTLSEALRNEKETTQMLAQMAFGLGGVVGVMLPYSRRHEYEADRIGLVLMAMAGYDPRAAVDFWGRMEELSGDASFDFLSTHPATGKRIRDMNRFMPQALEIYYRHTGKTPE